MRKPRPLRRFQLYLTLYCIVWALGGILVADGALRPVRKPVTPADEFAARDAVRRFRATLADVSITTPDSVVLRAWLIHPAHENGAAVLILHGLADNRVGMIGYAELLLAHGYAVLLPDARAHGASGGEFATYGLLERHDIRQWVDWIRVRDHLHCIFGFGESMGAAQLLQSLDTGAPFCAVAAESTFSNFHEIAYDRIGQAFQVGPWLGSTLLRPLVEVAFLRAQLKYKFDLREVSPEDSVARSEVPVLLIHGQRDSNIPVRHSRRIHARNPRTILWEVSQADHCGAISVAPQEFEQHLLSWFTSRN